MRRIWSWSGVRVTPGSLRPHLRWSFFLQRIRTGEVNYDNAKLATIPKGGEILNAVVAGVTERVQQMLNEA